MLGGIRLLSDEGGGGEATLLPTLLSSDLLTLVDRLGDG